MALIDEHKPLHVSIVGGEPLVRYRELDTDPAAARRARRAHAGRDQRRAADSGGMDRACGGCRSSCRSTACQPEHDERRTPATYDRILKHIEGHQITVHCTVTRQQIRRDGYLEEFLQLLAGQPEYAPDLGQPLHAAARRDFDGAADEGAIAPGGRRRAAPAAADVLEAADARRHAQRLRQPAAVTRRVRVRADDRVLLVGSRAPHHAVSVRRQSGLRELRLHRLRRPRGDRPASTAWRASCREYFYASLAVGRTVDRVRRAVSPA